MSRGAGTIPLGFIAGAVLLAACTDIPSDSGAILSFSFDPLPAPAVVAGDTLRDSAGVVAPVTITAFSWDGSEIADPGVRFSALDRGVRVDSLTGVVVGDSARSAARLLARVDGLTASLPLPVTFRPDSVAGVNARDSLSYSLTDSTLNVSNALSVSVRSRHAAGDTAVASWLVSFALAAPADTALARLTADGSRFSSRDTTDASGVAGRRIRLNVSRLAAPTDSIIVLASVSYRGTQVRGSPVRLVLKVKPR